MENEFTSCFSTESADSEELSFVNYLIHMCSPIQRGVILMTQKPTVDIIAVHCNSQNYIVRGKHLFMFNSRSIESVFLFVVFVASHFE